MTISDKEIFVLENKEITYKNIRGCLIEAQKKVYTSVNFAMVNAYWEIGRHIYNICGDNDRATYGKQLLQYLSAKLTEEFGKGFSVSNIQFMRRFYQNYQIQQTASVKLSWSHYCELLSISDTDKRSFYRSSH